MKPDRFPAAARRACGRCGAAPSRYFLAVDLARQRTCLFLRRARDYAFVKAFRCSTSKFGIGETSGSKRTPRGLHRVAQKVGGGWPVGTVFKGRQVTGFTWQGQPAARIAHRILWLEGLETGLNRGGQVDSHDRFIYIHGTGDETTLGRPDSHGCIHLASSDLMPLYDKVREGMLVWIG
jgi:hypothetical protein